VLLVTDRSAEGSRLQRTLTTVAPCTLVALHQPLQRTREQEIVICDVALDNIMSVELLRTVLKNYRASSDVPVLVLARDPSRLTAAQATGLGATLVMPYQSSRSEVVTAVRSLMSRAIPRLVDTDVAQVQEAAEEAAGVLADAYDAAKNKQPISPGALNRAGDAVISAVGQAKIRAWLDVVWTYDDTTYQHCLLVAGLVAATAQELGLTETAQNVLSQAALVHDIGKAEIPHRILKKAGRLLPEETAIMRTHPGRGYRMLAEQGSFDPKLLDVVLHHHEYLDGSGYPDKLHGRSVSRYVRLVTICDIYSALIERRPYKQPTPPDRALLVLVQMGRKLDAGLMRVFQTVVRSDSHRLSDGAGFSAGSAPAPGRSAPRPRA
jgi:putative nucleotidyltransferase with HDIG domain